jgi:hypothetical protein
VSSRTGAIETIGQFPDGLQVQTCDVTPDSAALICNLSQETSDTWVMSNFDLDIS